MVDETFFDFFNYEALAGDPGAAIQDVSSAVITEAAAMQLFGEPRPIGRVFTVDGNFDFSVAAVVSNNPANSHLVSNIYINNDNLEAVWDSPGYWENDGSDVMYHYARLAPGANPDAVAANVREFYLENISPGSSIEIPLQPTGRIQ